MSATVDHSLMTCYLDDASKAILDWGQTPGEATPTDLLLLSIAHSLRAIAVALSANHLKDRYP